MQLHLRTTFLPNHVEKSIPYNDNSKTPTGYIFSIQLYPDKNAEQLDNDAVN